MSERRQIDWLVAPDGAVVKYDAKKVERSHEKSIVLKTVADLHARTRLGLLFVDEILKKCGWHCNCVSQSSTSISLEIGKVMVDVSIRDPIKIAYVTSYPGWEYKREVIGRTPDITLPDGRVVKGQEILKPTAKVVIAGDFIHEKYVVQVITTDDKLNSSTPIYIPINKEMGDPAYAVAKNVLLTIRNLVGQDKLKVKQVEDSITCLQNEWESHVNKVSTLSG